MIFQKKIIIGSIMSFIATAIGVIAIFFPDLFNLQKEKIESIKMELNTDEDIAKFEEFMLKRFKDKKIFEIDVMACAGSKSKRIRIFDEDVAFSIATLHPDSQELTEEELAMGKEHSAFLDSGDEYLFPERIAFKTLNWRDTNGMCEDTDQPDQGVRVKGFVFANEPGGTHQGITSWSFTEVSESQIKIKNY